MTGSALLSARHLLQAAGILPGMRVADFGMGRSGHLVLPAARLVGEAGTVYGVDIHPEALHMVEGRRKLELLHNLELVWGDIERPEGVRIPPRSLDAVFVVNTLWFARKHPMIAFEVRRLLKSGGRVIIVDWHHDSRHPVAPPAQFRVHPRSIDAAFLHSGFQKFGEFAPSRWHWGRVYSS